MAEPRLCSIPDCGKPLYGHGLCQSHCRRRRLYGDPFAPTPPPKKRPLKTCSVEGCERAFYCRGWCTMHYERWRHHGDPLVCLTGRPLLERLMRHVTKRASGCWEWTGGKARYGYGTIYIVTLADGRPKYEVASRASWLAHEGPIPDGLFVLHECDNPGCVNPDHLFLGTQADNVADMRRKGRNAIEFRVPHCRLSREQVAAIRADSRMQKDIARDYGVSASHISGIKSGKARPVREPFADMPIPDR